MKRFVASAALAALIGSGLATAQIVPAQPPEGGQPPAAQPGEGGITPAPAPQPLPGPESQNDKEFAALLTGTWRLELPAPPDWRALVETTYNADGTFFSRQTSVSPMGKSEATASGTWVVKAIDRSSFVLSLTFTYPPNMVSASDTLTYIDQNTLYASKAQRNATRVQ
ncbi:MAG: hypothetical protein QM698_08925 [Micropepsaceae bacterium]